MTSAGRGGRIAVLAAFHETNVFCMRPTTWADFRVHTGAELVSTFAGTRTVLGGCLAAAADHDLEVVPIVAARATPMGTVTADAFDRIGRAIRAGLREAGPVDGVSADLHGAMVAADVPDAEEAIVAQIRAVVGGLPLAVTLDFHTNMSSRRLADVDILTGYRTNPHIDHYDRGYAATVDLARVLAGTPGPYRAHAGVPVIAAPVNQASALAPVRDLLARARELEAAHGFADVTVHAGYAYADKPYLGIGISVSSSQQQSVAADQAAQELAKLAWDGRRQFRRVLATPEQAFDQAIATPGLIAIADTGDNINGGSPGDGTWLIQQAARHRWIRTLVAMWAPNAVTAAAGAGVGGTVELSLGGSAAAALGAQAAAALTGPVLVWSCAVVGLGDGRYVNTGPMNTGETVSMGPVAHLRYGGVDIVAQTLPLQPNDPELFRSVGIDPAGFDVVILKGAAAIRAGWAPLVDGFVDAGTPGCTDSDLSRLTLSQAPVGLFRA